MRPKLCQLVDCLALLIVLFVAQGCRDAPALESAKESQDSRSEANDTPADSVGAAPPPVEGVGLPRVLFLGTSLTAGLGLAQEEAYPARLAELLAERGVAIETINAGVSGDTSAGGLSRLGWLLRRPPDILLIELGANDGLRGLPVETTSANLLEAVEKAQKAGALVLLAGMMMPPNYGEDYTRKFAKIYPRVAEATGCVLIPFLLEGVAADPALNLADGIHPNAKGQRRIAQTLLPFFVAALGTGSAG